MMAKSAEEVLNAMPSGDDLLKSLAQEIGLDLTVPVEEKKEEKPKQQKKETKQPKKEDKKESPKPKKEEKKDGTDANKKTVQKKKDAGKKAGEEKKKKSSFDRNEIFGEWYGYKVNYMGKPMDEEGKFVTLEKRYDARKQEKFRDVNGRMVMVVHRDKEGKAIKVQVIKETPDGKREEMPVATTMTNPHRMENRCRAYAQLLDLAYSRKTDIEEVGA